MIETIRNLLDYNAKTGAMTWQKRDVSLFKDDARQSAAARAAWWNGRFAGKPAFTATNKGYRHGKIFGEMVYAHRVAWAIHHGEWPDHIDHINGDRTDNRIANLRSVSQAENNRNRAVPSTNTSGVMGVDWNKGKWQARIMASGRHVHLGYFTDFDNACAARDAAEAKYGFHENHGRQQ